MTPFVFRPGTIKAPKGVDPFAQFQASKLVAGGPGSARIWFNEWLEEALKEEYAQYIRAEPDVVLVEHSTACPFSRKWPWELLHDATGHLFLDKDKSLGGRCISHYPQEASETHGKFSRSLPGAPEAKRLLPRVGSHPADVEPLRRPARALVLVCPEVLREDAHARFRYLLRSFHDACRAGYIDAHESLIVQASRGRIDAEIEGAAKEAAVRVESYNGTNEDEIHTLLRRGWDLIHVVGHGDDQLPIIGVDQSQIRPRDLLPQDKNSGAPRLVFLQSCHVGPDFSCELRSVEAVLGFDGEIEQLTIPDVVEAFYGSLGESYSEIAAIVRCAASGRTGADGARSEEAYKLRLWARSPRSRPFGTQLELFEQAAQRKWRKSRGGGRGEGLDRADDRPAYVPPKLAMGTAQGYSRAGDVRTGDAGSASEPMDVDELCRRWTTEPWNPGTWIIVGDRGSGRSTWVEHAAMELAGKSGKVRGIPVLPLVAHFRNLARAGKVEDDVAPRLFAAFAGTLGPFASPSDAEAFWQELRRDREAVLKRGTSLDKAQVAVALLFEDRLNKPGTVLFLDGWDDVAARSPLADLGHELPHKWIVVATTRPADVQSLAARVRRGGAQPGVLLLQPLDMEQLKTLGLPERLLRTRQMAELLSNPLRASLALQYHRRVSGKMTETGLYEALVAGSLDPGGAHGLDDSAMSAVRSVLQAAAWRAVAEGTGLTVSATDISVLCRRLGVGTDIAKVVGTDLIAKEEGDRSGYRFQHELLVEFLAACQLEQARGRGLERGILSLVRDPDAWGVLRLYAALLSRTSSGAAGASARAAAGRLLLLVDEARGRGATAMEERTADAAARGATAARKRATDAAATGATAAKKRTMRANVKQATQLPHAAGVLAGMLGAELWPVLDDEQKKWVREKAQQGQVGDLCSPYVMAGDPVVSGLVPLARVDRKTVGKCLDDGSFRVLLLAGGSLVRRAITEAVEKEQDPSRLRSLFGLAAQLRIGDAAERICKRLEARSWPDEAAGLMAIHVLGFLPHPDASCLSPLGGLAAKGTVAERVAAINALGRVWGELGFPKGHVPRDLEAACRSPVHPGVRKAALQALGRLKDDAHEETIRERLQDDSAEVRIAAVDALAELATQTACASLLGILDAGPSSEMGICAAAAILRADWEHKGGADPQRDRGSDAAISRARTFLANAGAEGGAGCVARTVLRRCGMRPSLDRLVDGLGHRHAHMRSWAADELAAGMFADSVDPNAKAEMAAKIVDALGREPNPAVRKKMLGAIGAFLASFKRAHNEADAAGLSQAVDKVLGRLREFATHEPAESVLCAVATAVGNCDGAGAVAILDDLLANADDISAEAAALALTSVPGEEARDLLKTATSNPIPAVSLCAAAALAARSQRESGSAADLYRNVSPVVRRYWAIYSSLGDWERSLLAHVVARLVQPAAPVPPLPSHEGDTP